jgi:opacity protein-like surface antigen
LYQGPVLASARVTGLSGAVTAVGDGADAIPWNPAAVALRAPYSTTRADWEVTGGVTLPSYVRSTDFDNNGKVGFTYDNFIWLMAGGLIQYDKLAFGVIASFQNYELGTPSETVTLPDSGEAVEAVVIRLLRIDPVVGYAFLEDQLHVGVGLRIASFYGIGRTRGGSLDPENERLLLNSNAIGAEAGVLYTPRRLPFRLGAAFRSQAVPTESEPGRIPANAEGDHVVGSAYLPDRLELPWEIEAGVAVQLWRRPFNLRWSDEDKVEPRDSEPYRRMVKGYPEAPYRGARRLLRERYAAIPRERVLLSLSGALVGPVHDAVGIESMLAQRVDRSGERTVASVRAGVEAEVLPYWLVLRTGSYFEPTRFREGSPRMHGTGGLDVRVLRSRIFGLFPDDTLFRLSLAVDAARDYFGWGVGAGVFH